MSAAPADAPKRKPHNVVAVNERTVKEIVKALMPTREWRMALAEYLRQTDRAKRSHKELSPEEKAPILQAILVAVQENVIFRNDTSLGDLAKMGFPRVLLGVLERQAKKIVAKTSA